MDKLRLPCLKGRIGDWFYYGSTISFKEIALRVKVPSEIDKKYSDPNLKLGEWIQRDIGKKRIKPISQYLINQNQRFFNSLVLGIYDGEPSWQELEIKVGSELNDDNLTEEELLHFSETFGILTLNGKESIFAIDGQHRVMGIRQAFAEKPKKFVHDEVSVIFIAHKTDDVGRKRTRRLFSTLNRYAKPVNKGEIIALSEDDNCAIITRRLIENNKYLKNRIAINKNKSISQTNQKHFTSVIMLYDIVHRMLTNRNIVGYRGVTTGRDKIDYTNTRLKDSEIKKDYKTIESLFEKIFNQIPALKESLVDNLPIKRNEKDSSLLFKVIGQNVLFDILKASKNENKLDAAISLFQDHDFSLKNKVWASVFWNDEKQSLITDAANQKYAKFLFLDKLDIPTRKTAKDIEIQNNYDLTI